MVDPNVAIDFRLLFESAPNLYMVLNPELYIVAVSDMYLAATKTERNSIVNRHLFDVFPDNPDDPSADGVHHLRTSLEYVLKHREANTMAVQRYDIRVPEAEGGGFIQRFWSPANSPVFSASGELVYIIHRAEDVTEFVRLKNTEEQNVILQAHAQRMEVEVYQRAQEVAEANRQISKSHTELEQLYKKTKELEELKTQFFANVSHELRTPLTLILGPVEKYVAHLETNHPAYTLLQSVARNARLLLKHVNDLLDVAKVESGKMQVNYENADLAYLLRLMSGHFESVAHDRQINFQIEANQPLLCQVDAEKIQRVLLNLLSNAFKFTPEGGQIVCHTGIENNTAILEVSDSGPGIPEDQRSLVFKRFMQVDGSATRKKGGTGLGLAIVHDFVEMHGGKTTISQSKEGGALFRIELPLRAPENTKVATLKEATFTDAKPTLAEFAAPQATSTTFLNLEGKAKILVTEDNPEMNNFIAECLRDRYAVQTAFNGKEALAKIEQLTPDLIISDIMMPEMSGDALVKAVRQRVELNVVPILLLSAKADENLRVSLLKVGAADYVTKPFGVEELNARVDNLIKGKLANDAVLRLNNELQILSKKLKMANVELEAFNRSVAHDLRTPLNAILGFGKLLSEDYEKCLDEQGQKYLKLILQEAEHMLDMTNAFLQLAFVGRADFKKEKVDLSELAKSAHVELLKLPPKHDAQIQVADNLTAVGDPRLLRILLDNLLGNAWKYTRKTPNAKIEFGQLGKAFYVRDNGAGFDIKKSDKLFQPFQRMHTEKEFPGTGIGLATVKRIIDRHEGKIWVEAEVGKGATFWFEV